MRSVKWSSNRNEIYVGNQDGTITFWNATKATPICKNLVKKLVKTLKKIDALKAHESDITHMQWFEKDRLMITSAKEKCIKVCIYL